MTKLVRYSVWCVLVLIGYSATVLVGCGKSVTPQSTPPVTPPDTSTKTTPPATTVATQVTFYETTPDSSVLLAKQNVALNFGTASNQYTTITVDSTQQYQTMDGFGFALTGGSAEVINGMDATDRNKLLLELFGSDSNSIGISYIRVSIGASDLSTSVFSYDDVPSGTDTSLGDFDLMAGDPDVVPVIQQILTINPNIKILACPWSAPAWMKTNNNSSGGSLLPQYYQVYANYLVKYIQAMQAKGITITAITPQNEPLNAYNNPAMVEQWDQEDSLVRFNIGPAFAAAGLSTQIIVYDHNCDVPSYATNILSDNATYPYVAGSAFHLYAGDITALSTVHDAYPNKNVYFTEYYTGSGDAFSSDLEWHLQNIIIGAPRNWSVNTLEWNLASDPNYEPHSPGGCSTCKGALTINVNSVTRNVSYYIIAHASKFVPAKSIRIASNFINNIYNVAYLRPDGKKVLIVQNGNGSAQSFNISFDGKWVTPTLPAGAVGTFMW
jgi:glucosylceramidase